MIVSKIRGRGLSGERRASGSARGAAAKGRFLAWGGAVAAALLGPMGCLLFSAAPGADPPPRPSSPPAPSPSGAFLTGPHPLRFDEIQTLMMHNAYFQHDQHELADGPSTLLWDQLVYHRVRAFELDIHPGTDWPVWHTVALANRNCDSLRSCLRTFTAFHRIQPDHEPITIWLEAKEDEHFIGGRTPDTLDGILRDALGSAVFTPKDAIDRCKQPLGDDPTQFAAKAIEQCGWPTAEELRGKFLFALYCFERCGASLRTYGSTDAPNRAAFIGVEWGKDVSGSVTAPLPPPLPPPLPDGLAALRRGVFVNDFALSSVDDATLSYLTGRHVILRTFSNSLSPLPDRNRKINQIAVNSTFTDGFLTDPFVGSAGGTSGEFWPTIPWDYMSDRSSQSPAFQRWFAWSYRCNVDSPDCAQSPNGPFTTFDYWPKSSSGLENGVVVRAMERGLTNIAENQREEHIHFLALRQKPVPGFQLTASVTASSRMQLTANRMRAGVIDGQPVNDLNRREAGCLMARADRSPGSAFMAICREGFAGGVSVLHRLARGDSTVLVRRFGIKEMPYVLRLEQTGSCWTASHSDDGVVFTADDTQCLRSEAPVPVAPLVGLAVGAAFNDNASSDDPWRTFFFSNIKVSGAPSPTAADLDATSIGATFSTVYDDRANPPPPAPPAWTPPSTCTYTPPISDEYEKHARDCPWGFVQGMTCSGRYCDDVTLQCCGTGLRALPPVYTPWFSDNTGGDLGPNPQLCPEGHYMSGLACRGSYCDDMRLACTSTGKPHANCAWTGFFSDPGDSLPSSQSCPAGQAAVGVECRGNNCDDLRIYCCDGP
jgi:hypothetical protein